FSRDWSSDVCSSDLVAPAGPGNFSRHTKFSSLPNLVGRLVSWLMPSSLAPRHWGQFSPCARLESASRPARAIQANERDPRTAVEDRKSVVWERGCGV